MLVAVTLPPSSTTFINRSADARTACTSAELEKPRQSDERTLAEHHYTPDAARPHSR